MAATFAMIAGRSMPSWMNQLVLSLVPLAALALVLQLEQGPPGVGSSQLDIVLPGLSAPEAPRQPRMLQLDRQMLHGDYVWNDEGIPAGRVEILIDIGTQSLHVFRSGHEIGRAVILYGTEENPTPLGDFTITEKDIDHESNLYEAMMPYMMRLTDDGIAIHGSVVEYGKASRGCIGVPDEFASLLFAQARLGDRVRIVNSGAPTAAAISTAI